MPVTIGTLPTGTGTYLRSSYSSQYSSSSSASSASNHGVKDSYRYSSTNYRPSASLSSYRRDSTSLSRTGRDDSSSSSSNNRFGVSTYTKSSLLDSSYTSSSPSSSSSLYSSYTKPPIGTSSSSASSSSNTSSYLSKYPRYRATESRTRDLSLDNHLKNNSNIRNSSGYHSSSASSLLLSSSERKLNEQNNTNTYNSNNNNNNNNNNNTTTKRQSSSARLYSPLDLYEKYSPSTYTPKIELSRSRSLSETPTTNTTASSNHNLNNHNSTTNSHYNSTSNSRASSRDRELCMVDNTEAIINKVNNQNKPNICLKINKTNPNPLINNLRSSNLLSTNHKNSSVCSVNNTATANSTTITTNQNQLKSTDLTITKNNHTNNQNNQCKCHKIATNINATTFTSVQRPINYLNNNNNTINLLKSRSLSGSSQSVVDKINVEQKQQPLQLQHQQQPQQQTNLRTTGMNLNNQQKLLRSKSNNSSTIINTKKTSTNNNNNNNNNKSLTTTIQPTSSSSISSPSTRKDNNLKTTTDFYKLTGVNPQIIHTNFLQSECELARKQIEINKKTIGSSSSSLSSIAGGGSGGCIDELSDLLKKQHLQHQQPQKKVLLFQFNRQNIEDIKNNNNKSQTMNCLQNSPDLFDDIKYIDSDDSERKSSPTTSVTITTNTTNTNNTTNSNTNTTPKDQFKISTLPSPNNKKLFDIYSKQKFNTITITKPPPPQPSPSGYINNSSPSSFSARINNSINKFSPVITEEIKTSKLIINNKNAAESSNSNNVVVDTTTAATLIGGSVRNASLSTSPSSSSAAATSSAAASSSTPSKWDRRFAAENGYNSYGSSGSSDKIDGLCGLRNIGNTCFMNSVIQCLSNTRELTNYLKTMTDSSCATKDQRILNEFAKLLREMWQSKQRSVTPSELKSAFSSKHRMYSGCQQQDAQEFLRFFIDSLHNATNTGVKGEKLMVDDTLTPNEQADLTWDWYKKVENSVIQNLFVGQFKSSLTCTVCGNTSVTFDPFWDLSVPLQSSSRCKLESCLDFFIKEEILDGDEMPTCAKCKTRRKSTKSFTIQRFPKYLVIHLKRFSETRWSKMTNIVEFPTSENGLDMAPYAANNSASTKYSLYGISNHMGSTAGGHYVALCKHPVTKKWHEFNDNMVNDASESSLVSSSAYLLFYERA